MCTYSLRENDLLDHGKSSRWRLPAEVRHDALSIHLRPLMGSNPSSLISGPDVGCTIKGYCNYFKHLETNKFLTLAYQSREFYPLTLLPTGSHHESRGSRAVQPAVPLLKASAPHRRKSQKLLNPVR